MFNKNLLLVEGKDDEFVIKALFAKRNLPLLHDIKSYQGYERLLEAIPVRVKESDVTRLGIIIDADAQNESRWQAVRTRLAQAGYENIPERLPSGGLVLEGNPKKLEPRLGVWIMPDNQLPGMLEDFLFGMIPEEDGLLPLANRVVSELPLELRKFSPAHHSKAIIHTWLAWQESPGTPLGQAITASFLRHECPQADRLVQWLHGVFFE